MLRRSLDPARRRPLSAALATGLVALLPSVLLTAPASAATKPAKPRGAAAGLDGAVLTARWSPARGTVQVAVRRPAGGKTKTTTKSFAARPGVATYRLPVAADRTTVRVRLRRCIGKGRAKRCGRWTGWLTPSAGSVLGTGTGGGVSGDGPTIGSCPQMPASWALNQRVDSLPLHPRSKAFVANIGARNIHPDFGSADLGAGPEGFGIPFRVVPASTPTVPTTLGDYADESDQGPAPIPLSTPVEGGASSDGDRHVLVVREGECILYELGNAYPGRSSWQANVLAKFDLRSGAARPEGWTSADAAGLPILPLLARYDEVASGRIRHAIRMTVPTSQRGYILPASHYASGNTDPNLPPMGLRLRLRADYDLSGMTGQAKVVATAMKEYGLVVADNGSGWFVTGAPDPRWNDDDLGQLKGIPGSAFEAVDSGAVITQAP